MDVIPDCTPPLEGRSCSQWAAEGYELPFERVIIGVNEDAHELTFDAPLVQSKPLDGIGLWPSPC